MCVPVLLSQLSFASSCSSDGLSSDGETELQFCWTIRKHLMTLTARSATSSSASNTTPYTGGGGGR